MPSRRFWAELKSSEFATLDPNSTLAVLPVAATEQHGPHLPVMTDTAIMEGMIATVLGRLPDHPRVLFLPIQTIGKSNEHLRSPGTITLSADTLVRGWFEIGESVHRAGLRKLVIVNSHGGNEEIMGIVARELRVKTKMLAVKTSWSRFGIPDGMIPEVERRHGIHGGEVETSLMLHFRPDLVDVAKARDFPSIARETEKTLRRLGPTGAHSFAWIASDLNPDGVVGDASAASPEKGRAIAEHQARGFVELIQDVRAVPLTHGFGSF
jgi:creatinine amidohydrolase